MEFPRIPEKMIGHIEGAIRVALMTRFDQALSGLPGRPQIIYETQHVTTMLGLVEAGLGVAAVPSIAMPGADHPLLVSVPLFDPVITRKIGLIRRKGRALSPAAQQLYAFFSEMKAKRGKPADPRTAS